MMHGSDDDGAGAQPIVSPCNSAVCLGPGFNPSVSSLSFLCPFFFGIQAKRRKKRGAQGREGEKSREAGQRNRAEQDNRRAEQRSRAEKQSRETNRKTEPRTEQRSSAFPLRFFLFLPFPYSFALFLFSVLSSLLLSFVLFLRFFPLFVSSVPFLCSFLLSSLVMQSIRVEIKHRSQYMYSDDMEASENLMILNVKGPKGPNLCRTSSSRFMPGVHKLVVCPKPREFE